MSASPSALRKAIAAGLRYILSRQGADGSWTEWALPPGSSAAWPSAYIGYRLRGLPPELMPQAAPGLAKAARWVRQHSLGDGGWGYNALVGSDADSTSCAILFLASASEQVPEEAFTVLATHQRGDGGFATYLPFGEPTSWNVSHSDVTPVALLAMLTHPAPNRPVIQRGIEYVLRQRTSLGLWNSFWWGSCLYATEASLSLLDTAGIQPSSPEALSRIEPTNAFEAALLILSLLHGDCHHSHDMIRDLVNELIGQQQLDGSWKTAPVLRITRRDCYEPWASGDAGPLYEETNRLFTTATMLDALNCSRSEKSRPARGPTEPPAPPPR